MLLGSQMDCSSTKFQNIRPQKTDSLDFFSIAVIKNYFCTAITSFAGETGRTCVLSSRTISPLRKTTQLLIVVGKFVRFSRNN